MKRMWKKCLAGLLVTAGLSSNAGAQAPAPALANRPADIPPGAVARVKSDETAAREKIAAIRVLAGADWSYWPEAQNALITCLRSDRNESVRVEAALAFGHGSCCTKPAIMALALTTSGGTDDGAPVERSPRVRAVAQISLNHCLAGCAIVEPSTAHLVQDKTKFTVPPPRQDKPATIPGAKALPSSAEYYRSVEAQPVEQVVGEARQKLNRLMPVAQSESHAVHQASADRGDSGLRQSAWQSEPVPPMVVNQPPTVAPLAIQPAPVAPLPVAPAATLPPISPSAPVPPTVIPPAMPVARFPQPVEQPKPAFVYPTATKNLVRPEIPPLPDFRDKLLTIQTIDAAPVTPTIAPTKPVAPTLARTMPPVIDEPAESGQSSAAPMNVSKPAIQPATENIYKRSDASRTVTTFLAPVSSSASSPVHPASTYPADSTKLLANLASSPAVEERKMAALYLAAFTHSNDLTIIQGLMNAALGDAAPSVRAASIQALIRLNNRSAPVLTTVQALRSDADPLVRSAAERAYRILTQTR